MTRLAAALLLAAGIAVPSHAEFVAQPDTFKCLQSGKQPAGKNFFVFNRNKTRLRKALRIAAKDLSMKHYPVGTVLQFFTREAMVKRGGHFNPEGGGWEFFQLDVSKDGTTIRTRGGAEVANFAGSCQNCHAAAKKFDFVCEGHNVASLNLPDNVIKALQTDPRCDATP
jgi:hypothetical protein